MSMFSGRISEMVAKQIENKLAEKNDLNRLTDSELSQLAVEFVGDAPPSHVPRETVIQILSQQPEIERWRSSLKDKFAAAAQEKVANMASNVDPRMVEMIKQQFGQWLMNSGMNTTELTTKIDTNKDGLLSRNELNQFIENLSGSQPPDWVSDAVIQIIDKDGNGVIEVKELWSYLESIGFEVPNLENIEVESEEEITEEDIEQMLDDVELSTETLLQESLENDSEDTLTIAEIDNNNHSNINDQVISDEIETNIVGTSIEKSIEILHSTRLHSEATAVIDNSEVGDCKLYVEKIERNLMVMDSYRGGMTITGLLDGGPFNVSVLFEPQYNEFIEKSEGKTVYFMAKLHDWSSGLRQAKLKGTDFKY